MRTAPKPLRHANADIPWRQIIDMRNIRIHAYHGINWQRVYDTARIDVPAFWLLTPFRNLAFYDATRPDLTAIGRLV